MKKDMTFEKASEELEAILAELSSEKTPLDDSLQLYAKAADLIVFCNEALKNAQIQIQEIDARTADAVSD